MLLVGEVRPLSGHWTGGSTITRYGQILVGLKTMDRAMFYVHRVSITGPWWLVLMVEHLGYQVMFRSAWEVYQ